LRTASECLAKAVEMDERAEENSSPEAVLAFRQLATSWRLLARSAEVQDNLLASLY
jgi:hypothetical protein